MLPLTFKLNFTVLVIPNFGRIKGLRWCCRELRSSQLDLAFFETPIGSSWVEANLLSPQLGSLDASLMEKLQTRKELQETENFDAFDKKLSIILNWVCHQLEQALEPA